MKENMVCEGKQAGKGRDELFGRIEAVSVEVLILFNMEYGAVS